MFENYEDIFVLFLLLCSVISFSLIYFFTKIDIVVNASISLFVFFLLPYCIASTIYSIEQNKDFTYSYYFKNNSAIEHVFYRTTELKSFKKISPLKEFLGLPDKWYDSNGDLIKNIKINIVNDDNITFSFQNLNKNQCQNIARAARIYEGKMQYDDTCKDEGKLNVSFVANSVE